MTRASNSYVFCPSPGYLTNTLSEVAEDNHFLYSDPLKVYEGIFIDVEMWGSFEISDIELNNIPSVSTLGLCQQELDSKPDLPPDVCYFLYLSIFFLKLMRQCRRVTFSTMYRFPSLGMHILGLWRTRTPRNWARTTDLRKRIP
jgi:hypothetical protein